MPRTITALTQTRTQSIHHRLFAEQQCIIHFSLACLNWNTVCQLSLCFISVIRGSKHINGHYYLRFQQNQLVTRLNVNSKMNVHRAEQKSPPEPLHSHSLQRDLLAFEITTDNSFQLFLYWHISTGSQPPPFLELIFCWYNRHYRRRDNYGRKKRFQLEEMQRSVTQSIGRQTGEPGVEINEAMKYTNAKCYCSEGREIAKNRFCEYITGSEAHLWGLLLCDHRVLSNVTYQWLPETWMGVRRHYI